MEEDKPAVKTFLQDLEVESNFLLMVLQLKYSDKLKENHIKIA